MTTITNSVRVRVLKGPCGCSAVRWERARDAYSTQA